MSDKISIISEVILDLIEDLCFWLIIFYVLEISINTGFGLFVIIFIILTNILIIRSRIEDRKLNKNLFNKNSGTMEE